MSFSALVTLEDCEEVTRRNFVFFDNFFSIRPLAGAFFARRKTPFTFSKK